MSLRRSIVFATSLFAPLGDWLTGRGCRLRSGLDDGVPRQGRSDPAATVVGLATTRIGVATGIAYSFSRHPGVGCRRSRCRHEVTGGRFASGPGHGDGGDAGALGYGIDEDRPVARLADAVALMRESWGSTGRFNYAGPDFRGRVEGLNQEPRTVSLPPLAVYGSGLNAAMLRGAAACCDGLA